MIHRGIIVKIAIKFKRHLTIILQYGMYYITTEYYMTGNITVLYIEIHASIIRLTWGLMLSFLQFSLSQATSISQSKWPTLQMMASSFICMKCSLVMIPLQPVDVTKICPWEAASSMVTTSYPMKRSRGKYIIISHFEVHCTVKLLPTDSSITWTPLY